MVFGRTVPDLSLNAIANLGYAGVKFHKPAFVGDTLNASSKIIGLKENSNGKTGTVYVESVGKNQNDEIVLTYYRWLMMRKRNEGMIKSFQNTIPDLPDKVKTEAKKLNTRIVTIIIRAKETVSSLLNTFLNILLKCSNI